MADLRDKDPDHYDAVLIDAERRCLITRFSAQPHEIVLGQMLERVLDLMRRDKVSSALRAISGMRNVADVSATPWRFRLLIDKISEGVNHGWQRDFASRLGIEPETVDDIRGAAEREVQYFAGGRLPEPEDD